MSEAPLYPFLDLPVEAPVPPPLDHPSPKLLHTAGERRGNNLKDFQDFPPKVKAVHNLALTGSYVPYSMARFWPWLSGTSPSTRVQCFILAYKRPWLLFDLVRVFTY